MSAEARRSERVATATPGVPRRGLLGSWRRRVLRALAVALAAGALATACTTPRAGLGTTDGPCFVALPRASAAVHGKGHFDGVRLVWSDSFQRSSRIYRAALLGKVKGRQQFCVVEYSGHFHRSEVEDPAGHRRGRLAIVVVTYAHRRLIVTIVAHHSPSRFGHPHVAPY